MINIYIDESGSMTAEHSLYYPHFVVALIAPKDKERLKRVYKRFISKKHKELLAQEKSSKMFKDGRFSELKGSCMTSSMKIEFLDYFCKNDLFEVYYIKIDNTKIRYGLYQNTARAFNYTLKQALEKFLNKGLLPNDYYILHIDERNEKTKTLYFLEEYLNTELHLAKNFTEGFEVKYYDSSCNQLIQIADVFSNIFYSFCFDESFKAQLSRLRQEGYIKDIYIFP